MKEFILEDRVNEAVRNFESGYNCAQSVFLAYSDVFEVDLEMAKKISVSFGGGIGRMREVCGAVSAMAMLAGFKFPVLDTASQEEKTRNYAIVQKMAAMFKEKHGDIICRNLLQQTATANTPTPSVRTAEYYVKRPCSKYVREAALIAGRMLKGELD